MRGTRRGVAALAAALTVLAAAPVASAGDAPLAGAGSPLAGAAASLADDLSWGELSPPGTRDEPWQMDAGPTSYADLGENAPAAVSTSRLAGVNRYETSALVSQRAFPAGSGRVYLARGDVLADAVAAGALTDGPVLLVPSCNGVPRATATEIARLDPDEVVALGTDSAVCDATLDQAAAGRTTGRLAGADRYGTAAAIAAHAFPDGAATVYLAEHQEFADAVAGGSLTDGPVLLVRRGSGTVPSATLAAAGTLDPQRVVALGGPDAVTPAALAAVAAGAPTSRVAGSNRYETAAAIAERAFPDPPATVYLSRGDVFADAVSAGSLTDGPVLLVSSDCRVMPRPVWRYLSQAEPTRVVALGDEVSVCRELLLTSTRMATFTPLERDAHLRLYTLVTKALPLDPLMYVPPDLVAFRGGSHRLRAEVVTQLDALFEAAAAAGKPQLWVRSGYRSYAEQQETYDYWVRTVGQERADQIAARPGHSEHQLGLAADLGGPSCSGWACFGETPEGRWVAANAHRFGFIIRYPAGGMPVTGYDYEPWHLRYVGPRAAWMMTIRGEVYWDYYQPTAVADGTF